MTDESAEPPLDLRSRALLSAVAGCSSGVGDLLGRHPNAAVLRKRAMRGEAESLAGLLWEELTDLERQADGQRADPNSSEDPPAAGTAPAYWVRRYRASQWLQWRIAAEGLPPYWLSILEMSAGPVREFYLGLGMDMITCAITGQPSENVMRSLAPLGSDLACAAAANLRDRDYWRVPKVVCDRWRRSLTRAMRTVTGEKVATTLGRSLLAALFRRLPDQERAEASRLARSSLPSLLEHDQFLEPADAADLEFGQDLIQKRLKRSAAARGRPEPREPQS